MNKTLLLFDLEDRYFLSHRRAIALAARDAGYRVIVCVKIGGKYMERIRAAGFECLALENENKEGISFLREFQTLLKLIRAYRKYRPRIVHHFGVRNLLHGLIAARLAKTPFVVNSLLGLGSLFSENLAEAEHSEKNRLVLAAAFSPKEKTPVSSCRTTPIGRWFSKTCFPMNRV